MFTERIKQSSEKHQTSQRKSATIGYIGGMEDERKSVGKQIFLPYAEKLYSDLGNIAVHKRKFGFGLFGRISKTKK